MIEAKEIYKYFGKTTVLKGVSACFEKGKTNLIIGQSGSGKTVFLKCLLGLYDIDRGTIAYDQRDLKAMDLQERTQLRQEVGMVFQGSALFDSMTVEENIMFPMKMLTSKPIAEIRERAHIVIKRVNLINAETKMPSEISGGMQKRVAIARAMASNPKVLLADEPTGALDTTTSYEVMDLIQKINDEGRTILVVTHEPDIARMCKRIVHLKDGTIEKDSPVEQVKALPHV